MTGILVIRRTMVCRNPKPGAVNRPGEGPLMCNGGGWWGDAIPKQCPRCGGRLTPLAPCYITPLAVVT